MKRRTFIAGLGAAAAPALWPVVARAQRRERVRRIGVLMGRPETGLQSALITAFARRMAELGWTEGGDLRIEVRWWNGNPTQMRDSAGELLALPADVMVTFTNLAIALLKPMLGSTPAVFVGVGDPVVSGFVDSLARPGGNITGFGSYEPSMGGKWLQILKETAPHLTRALAIMHAETAIHQAFWRSIEDGAPSLGMEATMGAIHDAAEIEHAISLFAAKQGGGLVVLPHAVTNVYLKRIIELEQHYRLPAVHAIAADAAEGALVTYGDDDADSFRHAAEYVDRILKGEKPADLPVQASTKFELVINLKTAKALGLDVPWFLQQRANRVIE
jgi:putative tryptophan/tyrosine transport system substrate-binding protein